MVSLNWAKPQWFSNFNYSTITEMVSLNQLLNNNRNGLAQTGTIIALAIIGGGSRKGGSKWI